MLCGKELVNRFVGADMRLFCMHLTISYTGLMGPVLNSYDAGDRRTKQTGLSC